MGRHKRTPEQVERDEANRRDCRGCGKRKEVSYFEDYEAFPVCRACHARITDQGIEFDEHFMVIVPCCQPGCKGTRSLKLETRLQRRFAADARCAPCAHELFIAKRARARTAKTKRKSTVKREPRRFVRRGDCQDKSPVGCRQCVHGRFGNSACQEDVNWVPSLQEFADMREGTDDDQTAFVNGKPMGGKQWVRF